jgi:hypothetical protein
MKQPATIHFLYYMKKHEMRPIIRSSALALPLTLPLKIRKKAAASQFYSRKSSSPMHIFLTKFISVMPVRP